MPISQLTHLAKVTHQSEYVKDAVVAYEKLLNDKRVTTDPSGWKKCMPKGDKNRLAKTKHPKGKVKSRHKERLKNTVQKS